LSIPSSLKVFRTLTPPIIIAVLIVVIHLIPVRGLDPSSWLSEIYLDKIVHVVAFACLSLSISRAFTKLHLFLYKIPVLMMIILVGCTGFGTILEIIQGELIDGRTADFLDIVADCTGSILGFMAFRGVYGVFPGQTPADVLISNSRIS
jgi:VanZ family protein